MNISPRPVHYLSGIIHNSRWYQYMKPTNIEAFPSLQSSVVTQAVIVEILLLFSDFDFLEPTEVYIQDISLSERSRDSSTYKLQMDRLNLVQIEFKMAVELLLTNYA